MISMKLRNWLEVESMLKTLPEKTMRSALKPAIRKGANIVRDEARTRAPKRQSPYPEARTATFNQKAWDAIRKARFIHTKYLPGKHRKDIKMYYDFRRPGTLKRGIFVGASPRYAKHTLSRELGSNGVFLSVGVDKRAYYGKFFELPKGFTDRGGRKHASRPFLRTALVDNAGRVLDIIRDNLSEALRKIQAGG